MHYYYYLAFIIIIIVGDSQAEGAYHPFQRGSSTSSDLCEMGKQSCDPFNIVW